MKFSKTTALFCLTLPIEYLAYLFVTERRDRVPTALLSNTEHFSVREKQSTPHKSSFISERNHSGAVELIEV